MNQPSFQGSFSQRWKKISRRIRVPLGFVFAIVYFWLARPSYLSLLASLALVAPGLLLRGYASGCVKKNEELTTTGPYAYTRNPLYLGSLLIASGFALASRSLVVAVVLLLLFGLIYLPVIAGEEEFLRTHFSSYDEYANRVPRLLPRFRVRRAGQSGEFSSALYRRHREYNSLLGSSCIYFVLIARVVFRH